eukprot:EG_transcript_28076
MSILPKVEADETSLPGDLPPRTPDNLAKAPGAERVASHSNLLGTAMLQLDRMLLEPGGSPARPQPGMFDMFSQLFREASTSRTGSNTPVSPLSGSADPYPGLPLGPEVGAALPMEPPADERRAVAVLGSLYSRMTSTDSDPGIALEIPVSSTSTTGPPSPKSPPTPSCFADPLAFVLDHYGAAIDTSLLQQEQNPLQLTADQSSLLQAAKRRKRRKRHPGTP